MLGSPVSTVIQCIHLICLSLYPFCLLLHNLVLFLHFTYCLVFNLHLSLWISTCLLYLAFSQQQSLWQISISFQFLLLQGHVLVVAVSALTSPEPHLIPGEEEGTMKDREKVDFQADPRNYFRTENPTSKLT